MKEFKMKIDGRIIDISDGDGNKIRNLQSVSFNIDTEHRPALELQVWKCGFSQTLRAEVDEAGLCFKVSKELIDFLLIEEKKK